MILWSHKTIKKAGVLIETASDDDTVHDNRVADTTRVVSLIIIDTAPKVKSSCITSRKGEFVLSKKFNLLKEVIDILSNPKLNAALGLLLTPTPLYEPSIEDIRRRDGISDKLYFSLEETEQPSDNQTE